MHFAGAAAAGGRLAARRRRPARQCPNSSTQRAVVLSPALRHLAGPFPRAPPDLQRTEQGRRALRPLIAFILAAIEQVISELPSPETVGDAIRRERRAREACRQLSLEVWQRDQQREKGKPA